MADDSNMYQVIKDFPRQCEEALKLGKDISFDGVKNITLTGIGGSAFTGDVLKGLLTEIDVFVNKNYSIPHFIDSESLVFVASYSGNTEEALDAMEKAISRNAKIVGIGKGGKLQTICAENNYPFITVPEQHENMQARSALGYMVIPLLNVLSQSGMIPNNEKEILEVANDLKDPSFEQRGKAMASTLAGKITIVYTPEELECIGIGWTKHRLNESAKVPAFSNTFPNLTHDELSTFESPRPNFHTIFFIDNDGHGKTRKRMNLAGDLIKEKTGVTVIPLEGNIIQKIFTSLHFGDWTAYYLAMFQGIDPTPTPLQIQLKKVMQDNVI